MGTAKILVAANSPGTLHRLKGTLAGLELDVAIRLRDVVKAVKESNVSLLVFCLGFDDRSTAELFASLDERGAARLPVVCVASDDLSSARRRVKEAELRASGACDFIELRDYPPGSKGDADLRARILSCLQIGPGDAARLRLPPANRPTTHTRTFRLAALLAGGVAPLAAQLKVSETALRMWMQGDAEPPHEVFIAALELVLLGIDRGPGRPS